MSKIKNNPEILVKKDYRFRFFSVSALVVLISLVYSYKLRWLGDDIFIGLRYVQNFLDGHGLVYNVGEKVEGYTDFLWIILISFFAWLKVDQLFFVQALGILSSIGTLILFSIITYKLTYPRNLFIVPFIGFALALNYDYNVWATGGLETAFYGFLLSAAFYTYFFSSLIGSKRKIITGLFLCLALLTRPDAILIIAICNILLLLQQLKNRIKISNIISDILFFNLAFLLIYIPYFIWRFNYYGFLFPNTFYVKLGNESMFSKGFYYLWLYFGVHFVSFLVIILPPFVLLPFIKRKVSKQENETVEKNRKAAFITSLLVVLVYLLGFVAKVGGDFMFARFIIPVAPFIYFIIYYSILKLVNEKNLNKVFILLLILSVIETKVRFEFFKGYDDEGNQVIASNNDVADERDVYVNFTPIEIDTKLGKAIHRAFNGIDAKVLIGGGQACFGYYSNFSYCQEMYGLTDTVIAHSVIESRGRIGHEKQGTLEYFQKKGIHFMFNRDFPSMDTFQRAAFILPPFDLDLTIVSYDTDIMNKLKERFGSNILFTDFPVYLDYYILNKLPVTSPDNLKKDYDNFNLYYFSHNNDIKREDQFLKILGYQIKK